MDITHVIAFNLALLAALISPGPALIVAIRTTLSAGRRAGVSLGIGLGLVASLWTFAALLGLEVVFSLFPWAYVLVKTAGALYLIYVAFSMWTNARAPIGPAQTPARHAFRQGVLINVLNPKSVLFAAAVLIVIFPSDMTVSENLIIVLNHFAMELLFYTGVAFAMSSVAVSKGYLRAKTYIDRIAAVVLGALGLRLLAGR